MKRVVFFAFSLIMAGAAGAADWVFRNVNVVTMDASDQVLENQTVVVSGGKIAALGAEGSVAIPPGAGQIQAPGRYLIPGLAEMHAHIPPVRRGDYLDEVLTLYLSQGITTVRGMLGEPGHLALRDAVARGERVAPRIYTSGPSFNGNSVSSAQQAVRMVDAQHAAGYDHLKIHPGLSAAEFEAIARRAAELRMPFVGHVTADIGARRAIAAGQTCIDHMDGFMEALLPPGAPTIPASFFGYRASRHADEGLIASLAETLAQAGTWVVPTEALMVRIAGPGEAAGVMAEESMNYVSEETRAQWRGVRQRFLKANDYDGEAASRFLALRLQLIGAIQRAGDRLLLGSDAPQVFNVPGFAIHRELSLYVKAGLTPFQALATGSVNVARYLGLENSRGRVRTGFDADLVLLEANPLEDISATRRIAGVMVAGRWLDHQWRQKKLAGIAARYATAD